MATSGKTVPTSQEPGRARLERLVRGAAFLAGALALVAWPAAWLLERQAQRVQLIAPWDDALVSVNRFTYAQEPSGRNADVIAIYGTPFGDPQDVLFADEAQIMHPQERPDLVLLKKGADDNPLQVTTVRYVATMLSLGAGAAALALALGAWLVWGTRRRRARHATP